eukprot:UN05672
MNCFKQYKHVYCPCERILQWLFTGLRSFPRHCFGERDLLICGIIICIIIY